MDAELGLCLFWRACTGAPGIRRHRGAGTGGVDHPRVSREGAEGERERERGVLELGRDRALRSREDVSETFQEETVRPRCD